MYFPEEVFNSFSFLRNMFSNEFILCPGATVQVRNIIYFMFILCDHADILYAFYFSLVLCVCVGLRGGLLPPGEDWSSAGHPAGGPGDGERTQNAGLPHLHVRSLLTRIPGEGETQCGFENIYIDEDLAVLKCCLFSLVTFPVS